MQERDQFFETLYAKNKERIYNFIYKLVGNEDTAMEIMQESFVNYYQSYGKLQHNEQESLMLLYTIARNLSGNYLKKFSTRLEISSDSLNDWKSETIHFEKRIELNSLENQLYECLGELTEALRTAFVLRVVEEMSLPEISRIMGISISTASRLVVKATVKIIELAKQKGIQF